MDDEKFIEEIEKIFKDCLEIVKKKSLDYAVPDDPFKNFKLSSLVGVSPDRAILVRLTDKLSRMSNLLDKKAEVKDEKIQDTISDMINYLAILMVYLKHIKR